MEAILNTKTDEVEVVFPTTEVVVKEMINAAMDIIVEVQMPSSLNLHNTSLILRRHRPRHNNITIIITEVLNSNREVEVVPPWTAVP